MIANDNNNFDPFLTALPEALRQKSDEATNLVEALTWYSGDPEALEQFYKSCNFKSRQNFFWRSKLPTTRAVHSGLPSLLSEKMGVILFGPGLTVTVSPNRGDPTAVQKRVDDMIAEMDLIGKLKEAAQAESWSGHVALKICYDKTISKYPIIEVYDRRYFSVVKSHGLTTSIIFKSYYETKKDGKVRRYRLDETYTTDAAGKACIICHLFQIEQGREDEVDLETLPETAGLLPYFVFEGITGMLAFDKPNRGLINVRPENLYGRSDYARSFSVFDGLDEVISAIVGEIRTNKTLRYIPQDMIPVDDNGHFQIINDFVDSFIKVLGDRDQTADNRIDTTSIPDKTAEHLDKYRIFVGEACNLSGLSPLSLGITGLEAINSSDRSTRERSKTTLETRKDKVGLWTPVINRLVRQSLKLWSVISTDSLNGIDPDSLAIDTAFKDYIEAGIEDRVNTWSNAKMNGVCSIEMAVSKIHGDDLSEDLKKQEANRIRLEQGMLADPDEDLLKIDLESEESDDADHESPDRPAA